MRHHKANFYIGEKSVPQQSVWDAIGRAAAQMEKFGIREKQIICCQSKTAIGIYVLYHAAMHLQASVLLVSGDYPAAKKLQSAALMADVLAIWDQGSIRLERRRRPVALEIPARSVLQMTSATTGEPKMVLRTEKQIHIELKRYLTHMRYGEHEERFLPAVPFYHSFGFICVMLAADRTGGTILLPDILLPRRVAELSERMHADYLYGVPHFLDAMLRIGGQYTLGKKMCRIVSSGGRLSAETAAGLTKKFDVPVLQQYGCSEAGSLAVGRCRDDSTDVGRPIGNIVFSVAQKDGQSVICVDTAGSAGAYVDEATGIHSLDGHEYFTNDIGYIDETGSVHITGRADDVMIIAGKKISRQRIQSIIGDINGIHKAVVSISKKPPYDLICRYSADFDISDAAFRRHCETRLAGYEIPTRFIRSTQELRSWKDGFAL